MQVGLVRIRCFYTVNYKKVQYDTMRSWFERYEKYQNEIKECEKIKDVTEKAIALLHAEKSFNLWIDIYPESEPKAN